MNESTSLNSAGLMLPSSVDTQLDTVQDQSQNVQQQYKQAIDAAMQQPRPEPDEK